MPRMNAVVTSVVQPTTLYSGQKTVASAGTPEPLASTQAILSGVTIKALHGNTGMVYIGDGEVSGTTGLVLDAGESVFVEVADLAAVWVDVETSGDGVSYAAS